MSLRPDAVPSVATALLLAIASVPVQAQSPTAPTPFGVTTRLVVTVPAVFVVAGLEVVDVHAERSHTEVLGRITVRGNLAYQVRARATDRALADSGQVMVRRIDGAWVALPASGSMVVAEGNPGEQTLDVGCRVMTRGGVNSIAGCGLTYQVAPRDGDETVRAQAVLAVTPAASLRLGALRQGAE